MRRGDTNYCECCGAKLVEYKHGLSKGLCRSLAKAVVTFGDTEPHDIKDMPLDYNHRCNFQKLRYWGLVEKIGDSLGKGGKWRVTEKGMSFVKNEISVDRFVWTYRGEVESYDGEKLFITDITGGWQYRIEYAKDRRARA